MTEKARKENDYIVFRRHMKKLVEEEHGPFMFRMRQLDARVREARNSLLEGRMPEGLEQDYADVGEFLRKSREGEIDESWTLVVAAADSEPLTGVSIYLVDVASQEPAGMLLVSADADPEGLINRLKAMQDTLAGITDRLEMELQEAVERALARTEKVTGQKIEFKRKVVRHIGKGRAVIEGEGKEEEPPVQSPPVVVPGPDDVN